MKMREIRKQDLDIFERNKKKYEDFMKATEIKISGKKIPFPALQKDEDIKEVLKTLLPLSIESLLTSEMPILGSFEKARDWWDEEIVYKKILPFFKTNIIDSLVEALAFYGIEVVMPPEPDFKRLTPRQISNSMVAYVRTPVSIYELKETGSVESLKRFYRYCTDVPLSDLSDFLRPEVMKELYKKRPATMALIDLLGPVAFDSLTYAWNTVCFKWPATLGKNLGLVKPFSMDWGTTEKRKWERKVQNLREFAVEFGRFIYGRPISKECTRKLPIFSEWRSTVLQISMLKFLPSNLRTVLHGIEKGR